MSIKPLSDRVLVEPAAAETKTAGGIYIPDTAKEKPQKGTVIAVGPGKVDEPTTVKKGDLIAEIGSTGRASGPHLDWRMNWRDRRIDPQLLVPPMPTD